MNDDEDCPYYFFFGRENPLSNWYVRDFVYRNVTFRHNEAFMMYCKAMLFGDTVTARKILDAIEPGHAKLLGRQVVGFNEELWAQKREYYVYIGSLAKFSQHRDLGDFLLATGDKILVEASRSDRIWGAGLHAHDPLILDPKNWRGLNLLGPVQERVRSKLRTLRSEEQSIK